ncbi:MAG: Bax inhibitor-1/YccA family protein [Actinobacteria bacterium]|nr:Bax inhibitor-1/YccA family protein [Actinomycetota bacterium]
MANPILNEKKATEVAAAPQAGWGAPDPATRATPIDDGPVSPWKSAHATMTLGGTVTATGVLLVLLLGASTFGWLNTDTNETGSWNLPAMAIVGVLVGFVCAIVVAFKPGLAKILGPIYAIAEGVFLGAISAAYNSYQSGIVVQAVGATLGVFVVMLVLYSTRIIKVTNKFRRAIIFATIGLGVFYLVSMVFSLFGHTPSFISDASGLGIAFSIFAAGLASMNLLLDFDLIERGTKEGWPKQMEWFCAFGLLITLVWLYLELLRLLSKLQRN